MRGVAEWPRKTQRTGVSHCCEKPHSSVRAAAASAARISNSSQDLLIFLAAGIAAPAARAPGNGAEAAIE